MLGVASCRANATTGRRKTDGKRDYAGCKRGIGAFRHFQGSATLLVQARMDQLRWAGWPDRHHADRAGRPETVDRSADISERPQFLYAAAGPGSAAARGLYRLAPARFLGRVGIGQPVRPARRLHSSVPILAGGSQGPDP